MVGEPKPARLVEHDVVRAAQRMAAAFGVQHLDRAGFHVHALNASAGIAVVLIAGEMLAVLDVPAEAAVVANIAGAVGADRGAIGAAAGFRHDLDGAVRFHPAQGAAGNLHQNDIAVGHGDGAFGELQAGCDFS